MNEWSLPHLNKLKGNTSALLAMVYVSYGLLILYLFLSYKDKAEIEKAQILQDNYDKIVQVSTGKIGSLLQRLSTTLQDPDISINTNTSDLEVCSAKCLSYSKTL